MVVQILSQKQIEHTVYKGNGFTCLCCMCVPNLSHNSLFKDRYDQRGWGVGEGEFEGVLVLRISSDRDDQMGTKRKRKKSLDQYSAPPPHHQKKGTKSHPGIRRNYQESSKYPKEFPMQIKVPKKILEFSSQNFKPKQSFDHSRHMKSGVPLRAATYIIYQVSGGICSVEYDLKEKDAIK